MAGMGRLRWSWAVAASMVFCGDAVPIRGQSPTTASPTEVELFDAIRNGRIAVRVVPTSYFMVTMTVQNRTRQPLKVKTPEVFAAVATRRLRAWQTASRRGRSQNDYAPQYDPGGTQSLGGSFYYGDASPGAQSESQPKRKPAEFTLLPAGRVTVKIPTFCMEFGLPDPNPRIAYTLVPLEVVTRNRAIKKVLTEFGQGKHHQAVAQLAMWHVANGTPWEKLAQVQWPGNFGRVTPIQLRAARLLAEQSRRAGAKTD